MPSFPAIIVYVHTPGDPSKDVWKLGVVKVNRLGYPLRGDKDSVKGPSVFESGD